MPYEKKLLQTRFIAICRNVDFTVISKKNNPKNNIKPIAVGTINDLKIRIDCKPNTLLLK